MVRIPLHYHGSVAAFALVDDADAERIVAMGKWNLLTEREGRKRYAYISRRGHNGGRNVYMHRAILGLVPGDGLQADHVNRNGLDNRRENLRVVTPGQNSQNCRSHHDARSKYRNVSWNRCLNRWIVRIRIRGHDTYIGRFTDEDAAGAAAAEARSRFLTHATD